MVSTPDGNAAPVIREGTISLTDNVSLDIVLVVPSLDYNLLSVAQLTVALNYIVIFWPLFVCSRTSKLSGQLVMVLGGGSFTTCS